MIKRKQSRLLVESILKGNTQKADKLLAKIIAEAEEDRQEEARAEANDELGITDDQEEEKGDAADNTSTDLEDEFDLDDGIEDSQAALDDSGDETNSDDEFSSTTDTTESDTAISDLADKQVKFETEINNLVLNDLLNKVADLKTALENNTTLDKHSREFYQVKVPLQYYGDTLLKMQKNITPLVNQDEIKKQLDEIDASLQELSDKIGINDGLSSIDTPQEVLNKEAKSQF